MPAPSISPAHYVRRGLLKIDDDVVLAAVDSLDLRSNAKISAVIGMPLRSLQQRRDVAAFAVTAPIAAAKGLLELLAASPLEKVVASLGDHADSPTYEQLANAVDDLLAHGSTDDDVVALLTFAIAEEFPAAPHCRRLLDERPAFALPELPEAAGASSILALKAIDPEVREQRRARREEEKRKKRNTAPVHPARPVRAKTNPKATTSSTSAPLVEVATVVERRRVTLTPSELERFRADHPFVGTVVLAEVPFDSVDPATPEQRAKLRPGLVVAASDTAILVRAIYSNPSTTRVVFQPWRRLGFDHVSYIDDHRTALPVANFDEVERRGRVTDDEWNVLF
ncbi:MAG: hypothetical protein WA786_06285 [Acidimicrobiales bacterium]